MSQGLQRVRIADDNGRYIDIDPLVPAFPVIDSVHHEIHEGEFYSALKEGTLASGAQLRIAFRVPAGKAAHLVQQYRSSGEANGCLYKGVSFDTNSLGTVLPSYNHRIDIGDNSVMSLTTSPSIVVTGTCIDAHHFGAGVQVGGESDRNQEFILTSGDYLFILTSEAAANDCLLRLAWYEESI